MGRLFGTDGVRGTANAVLTAELALELSVAAAHVLGETGDFTDRRPVAVVGRDPRASGEFLEAAVVAGLASAGVDVVRVGVIPTPGLAWLVSEHNYDLGVMLSASHNAMPDNGIKFFARGGVKLDDAVEDAIEAQMNQPWTRPLGGNVGRVHDGSHLLEGYISHLVSSLSETHALQGVKVVLDCANGASSVTAREAFEAVGAEVIAIHSEPDGLNINLNCGSTHMEDLQAEVVKQQAHFGLAFDGDADRCLAVDHEGNVVDGDQILLILGIALKESDMLPGGTVVATVMSNLGFMHAMKAAGINVDVTKVGDRYVLESMNANGFGLGGEQSGHVVMSAFATTGDGVLTGLHLAARVARTGKTLQELASLMTRLPQVMINVPNVDKSRAGLDPQVKQAVIQASQQLGDSGRVVLRPSGTEPLVRVMVEAATEEEARAVAQDLAEVVKRELSLS